MGLLGVWMSDVADVVSWSFLDVWMSDVVDAVPWCC